MDKRKAVGKRGEDVACQYLLTKGYKLLEKNYTCPLGEIDIVAQVGKTIVFVEVRSISTLRFGPASLSVDRRKQKKLSQLSLYYLQKKGLLNENARFDVVSVNFSENEPHVELFPNAFDWQEA